MRHFARAAAAATFALPLLAMTATAAAADDRLDDLIERQAETITALEEALELAKMQSVVLDRLLALDPPPEGAAGEAGGAKVSAGLYSCDRLGFAKVCYAN